MENQQWYVPRDAKFGDEIAPNIKYVGVQDHFTILYDIVKQKILYTVSPEEHQKDVDAIEKFRNRSWWKRFIGFD